MANKATGQTENHVARLDASGVYYRDLNAHLKKLVADSARKIELRNVCGQRYIGTDIESTVEIDITGTPGNDLGAFMNGPRIIVHGNAQDGCGNTMNEGEIIVHGHAGEAVGRGANRQIAHREKAGVRAELGVLIFLAEVDRRQSPQPGHIGRLVEYPLIQRAVAEKTARHLSSAANLAGIGRAGGDADASADDAVRAQNAEVEIGDVHRAALAVTITRGLAQEFGHHRRRLAAFGEAMPVPAMRAGNVVVAPERGTRADRHGLLADVHMRRAPHPTLHVQFARMFLE